MALRIPTADDLNRLAQVNHFELNDEELARDMSLDWRYYGETISTRR